MPPRKKSQEEELFTLEEPADEPAEPIVRQGAYGAYREPEPHGVQEAEPTPSETTEKIGELAVEETVVGKLENKRERFKEKFEDKPWTPRFQYEMTLALQTLPIAIRHIAEHMPLGNQRAVRQMYETAMGYSAQAWRILHDINNAYDFEGDEVPSTGRIRRDYQIRLAVAEHLLARESFEELDWPDRRGSKKPDRERRLIKIADGLKDKSEEELLKDWADAQQSFTNEAEFWDEQLMSVQDSQRVKEIQSENRSRRL